MVTSPFFIYLFFFFFFFFFFCEMDLLDGLTEMRPEGWRVFVTQFL